MKRVILCICMLALLVACSPKSKSNEFACPDCNVILISIDTVRADHLPCYGYKKNTTPNICKFAEQGVLFENAYSQAPVTVYALLSMMTGRVVSNKPKEEIISFYGNVSHLSEVMHSNGYTSAAFTDHIGLDKVKYRGFDSWLNVGQGLHNITSQVLVPPVLDWLDDNYSKRFFLWVHFFDPHYDYMALPEYEKKFGSSKNCGRIYNGVTIRELRKISDSNMTQREIECVIGLYDAELFYTDLYVGKILDKIDSLMLSSKTLVIITADHGEQFNERGYIGHEINVYNELLRVPLIMKSPYLKPGTIQRNFATKDIFHVISNQKIPDEEVVSRSYQFYGNTTKPHEYAVISGQHKLIYTPDKRKVEFYDLEKDPGETKSINHTKLKSMKDGILSWVAKNNVTTANLTAGMEIAEQEANERLRSLGYAV